MILWIKADCIQAKVDQRARFIAFDQRNLIVRLCGTDEVIEVHTRAVCGFEVCDEVDYKFTSGSVKVTEISCRNCEG